VEARLQQLEGKELGKSSGAAHGKANIESYDKDRKKENPGVLSAAKVKQDIDIVPLIQLPNNKAS
jgi:nucleolar protein 58